MKQSLHQDMLYCQYICIRLQRRIKNDKGNSFLLPNAEILTVNTYMGLV